MSMVDRIKNAVSKTPQPPPEPAKPERDRILAVWLENPVRIAVLRPSWSEGQLVRIVGVRGTVELNGRDLYLEQPEPCPAELVGEHVDEVRSARGTVRVQPAQGRVFSLHTHHAPLDGTTFSAYESGGHVERLQRLTPSDRLRAQRAQVSKLRMQLEDAEARVAAAQKALDEWNEQTTREIERGGAASTLVINHTARSNVEVHSAYADQCREALRRAEGKLEEQRARLPEQAAIDQFDRECVAFFDELKMHCEAVVAMCQDAEPLIGNTLRAKVRTLLGSEDPLVSGIPWAILEGVARKLDNEFLVWQRKQPNRWRQ